MVRTPRQYVKKSNRPDGVAIGILVGFLILASVTATLLFIFVRNLVAGWTLTEMTGVADTGIGSAPSTDQSAVADLPDTPLQEAGPTAEPWDGVSRITILFLGLDYRDWEAGDIPRSDTMMLLTLDPISGTAGMLSIPRDLWVNVPDVGYNKINTAYYFGEIYHLPDGGPGLAMRTVEELLGIPINYYVQVDFYTFIQLIDEIGGIHVTPSEDITVERMSNGYEEVLPAGQDILIDGELALAYARERHLTGDDFGRSARQQEVIMAVRNQILNFNQLPNLITRAPAIYQEVSNGIHTNLSLGEALQLAQLALQIPPDRITRGQISANDVIASTSPDGLDILIPIPDQIRIARDAVFSTGGSAAPLAISTDPAATLTGEAARISLQNGTYTEGLAASTASYLTSQGLNVVDQANANYTASTLLYVYGAKPYTLSYLATLFNVPSANIYNAYDPNAAADIVVIIGDDWAMSNPMP
jgi:LCP family protein required for cell wall assembly